MITVKLTKDVESAGLHKGDVLSVDKLSAAAMVKAGKAEVVEEKAGGHKVETIDDIHDPDVKHDRRVQTVARVGGPEPKSEVTKHHPAASGAKPVGGTAHEGTAS